MTILRGSRDLDHLAAQDEAAYIWQPYLERFEEYSIDFAIDTRGECSPLACRRRVRTTGGFAVVCEPGAPPPVEAVAQATVEQISRLGGLGPMNLQILQTKEGCWVSDLNPRIGTSMPLSLAVGANPIAWLFRDSQVEDDPGASDLGATVLPAPRPTGGRSYRSLIERHVPALDLVDVAGVVFDLDDTLLDQKRWIADKLELTWAAHRGQLPQRDDFMQQALHILEEGNRARLIDALCEHFELSQALRETLINTYRTVRPPQASVYDDVLPTLAQLRRQGLRLGLLTDNPPPRNA